MRPLSREWIPSSSRSRSGASPRFTGSRARWRGVFGISTARGRALRRRRVATLDGGLRRKGPRATSLRAPRVRRHESEHAPRRDLEAARRQPRRRRGAAAEASDARGRQLGCRACRVPGGEAPPTRRHVARPAARARPAHADGRSNPSLSRAAEMRRLGGSVRRNDGADTRGAASRPEKTWRTRALLASMYRRDRPAPALQAGRARPSRASAAGEQEGALLAEHLPGDDEALNLVRPLVDLRDLRVASMRSTGYSFM